MVCSAGACLGGCPALALALFGIASALRLPWREFAPVGCLGSALRLPWRRLVWRVSCDCPGTAWSSERLAFALAPVCLAELWREFALAGCLGSALRLPWRLSAWRSCGGSLPRWAALGAPCVCLAPFGLDGVLRVPWRCLVWRAPCVCLGACLPGGVVAGVSPGGCLPRRVSCACLGAVWSSERLAFALAPVCLAEL